MTIKEIEKNEKTRKFTAKYGHKKYFINKNFFKTWSSDMAYILGFWWADGNITTRKYIFTISQHKDRKYILSQMLVKMGSNHPVRKTKNSNCYRFEICSFDFVSDIMHLGGEENKSLKCKFPKVPKIFLPDFIRGLWDGDGCISYNKISKNHTAILSSGSKKLIQLTHKLLKGSIKGLGGSIVVIKPNGRFYGKYLIKATHYQLVFSTNDTKRLGLFMYSKPKGLCLKDKKDKFLDGSAKKINICSRNKVFLSYSTAKKTARQFEISNRKHWEKLFTEKKLPAFLPAHPQNIYKNKGWVSWYDFLGKQK